MEQQRVLNALLRNAGNPPRISCSRVHDARALHPGYIGRLVAGGQSALRLWIGETPADFSAAIHAEIPVWAKVIRDSGLKLSQ
jgi:hypothetical protein